MLAKKHLRQWFVCQYIFLDFYIDILYIFQLLKYITAAL